ncbi:hypothetical protein BB560_001778 [Smittium megazygosporum]|uniref:Uncharacterized protein n=1 Tax=Smittium megazygosporum TaxID=133381 RepID=A0A2T9ZGL5_9FUNG|nr:hypothetical protein BB560_001778 [Smittium megazygosporum]
MLDISNLIRPEMCILGKKSRGVGDKAKPLKNPIKKRVYNYEDLQARLEQGEPWFEKKSKEHTDLSKAEVGDTSQEHQPLPRYAMEVVYSQSLNTHFMFGGNENLNGNIPSIDKNISNSQAEAELSNGEEGSIKEYAGGGNRTAELRLNDMWKMKLKKPTVSMILRRSVYMVRKAKFIHLCMRAIEDNSKAALYENKYPSGPFWKMEGNSSQYRRSKIGLDAVLANGAVKNSVTPTQEEEANSTNLLDMERKGDDSEYDLVLESINYLRSSVSPLVDMKNELESNEYKKLALLPFLEFQEVVSFLKEEGMLDEDSREYVYELRGENIEDAMKKVRLKLFNELETFFLGIKTSDGNIENNVFRYSSF